MGCTKCEVSVVEFDIDRTGKDATADKLDDPGIANTPGPPQSPRHQTHPTLPPEALELLGVKRSSMGMENAQCTCTRKYHTRNRPPASYPPTFGLETSLRTSNDVANDVSRVWGAVQVPETSHFILNALGGKGEHMSGLGVGEPHSADGKGWRETAGWVCGQTTKHLQMAVLYSARRGSDKLLNNTRLLWSHTPAFVGRIWGSYCVRVSKWRDRERGAEVEKKGT
ncbi:hypothetical protein BD779DRAFT_1757851 [Infundibulicybe gibba]|nr:hypothetical protein BD779DRAFT_1757851 [Infundibulicybe gibba]